MKVESRTCPSCWSNLVGLRLRSWYIDLSNPRIPQSAHWKIRPKQLTDILYEFMFKQIMRTREFNRSDITLGYILLYDVGVLNQNHTELVQYHIAAIIVASQLGDVLGIFQSRLRGYHYWLSTETLLKGPTLRYDFGNFSNGDLVAKPATHLRDLVDATLTRIRAESPAEIRTNLRSMTCSCQF